MPRDRAFERSWLERVAHDPGFAPLVAARLERSSAELGEDSFRERSLLELLDEIHEEALDLAGWGVLAHQLPPPDTPDADRLARVFELVDLAARLGAQASLAIRTARSYLTTDAPA